MTVIEGARRARRTVSSTAAEMRDVARREPIGRVALFVVWVGLIAASGGTAALQFTPSLARRELI
jgi:hypothetical protein